MYPILENVCSKRTLFCGIRVVLNLIKGTGDRWADDATEVDGDVPEDDSNESEDDEGDTAEVTAPKVRMASALSLLRTN